MQLTSNISFYFATFSHSLFQWFNHCTLCKLYNDWKWLCWQRYLPMFTRISICRRQPHQNLQW